MNTTEHPDITIPAPSWASFCDEWDWTGPAKAWRYAEHHLTECGRPWCVSIAGRQDYSNGVVTDAPVTVELAVIEGASMTPSQAREMSAQLVEAATLADWANGLEPDKKPTD